MSDTRRRVRLCHLGMLVIALVANLAPPLFIPLRTAFGLDFEQLGRLALFNFITQLVCILLGGSLVDRFGARPFAILGNGFTFGGLWLFAFADRLFPATPYTGLALGTFVFSIGGAMLELVLSPIVNAVASERKAADMSLLHAFYALGQFATVKGARAILTNRRRSNCSSRRARKRRSAGCTESSPASPCAPDRDFVSAQGCGFRLISVHQ